jgi:tRNA(Ile)-lysidine synthase
LKIDFLDTKDFYDRFIDFVESNDLFSQSDHILVATSGGVDSMVLCYLMHQTGISFSIAHMNFGLRSPDCDEDSLFVEKMAKDYQVDFYQKKVNTKDYSTHHGISIEMAARELRYSWFDELLEKHAFSYVATGHHLNDQTESILLNLCRGTAISGLQGIVPKKEKIIRPLLFAGRDMILEYAKNNALSYRIDQSNEDIRFQRNRIRKHVVPQLESINPSLHKTLNRNARLFEKYITYFSNHFKRLEKQISQHNEDGLVIDWSKLEDDLERSLFLYSLLSEYGFNSNQLEKLEGLIKSTSEGEFLSNTHRLLVNRNEILLVERRKIEKCFQLIQEGQQSLQINKFEFEFSLIQNLENEDLKNPMHAYLNYEALSFPLLVRNWRKGDRFIPYGMSGFKKLSDYFIDNKISRHTKEEILLLESGEEIAWLIGLRIDDRYKVNQYTNKIFKIELKKRINEKN